MGRYTTNYDGCGIYALFNVIDAKIYIGQSKNIKRRFLAHKIYFATKSNLNPVYQEPIEKFVFLVLYKCDPETFRKFHLILEEMYIHKALENSLKVYNKMQHKAGAKFLYNLESIFEVGENMNGSFIKAFGRLPFRMVLTSAKTREQDIKNFPC